MPSGTRENASGQFKTRGKQVPVSLSGAIYTDIAEPDTDTETVLRTLRTRLQEAIAQGGNRIISAAQESEKARVSVDQALQLIVRQNTDSLEPVAQDLMLDILPLLEYSDSVLKLGMKSVNQSLREKLK